jgi:hypothetical protein
MHLLRLEVSVSVELGLFGRLGRMGRVARTGIRISAGEAGIYAIPQTFLLWQWSENVDLILRAQPRKFSEV